MWTGNEIVRGGMTVLSFEVGGRHCAVPLAGVQEVLRAVAITRLPHAPSVVEGVISVRGTLVPVMDARRRMGLPEKAVDLDDRLVLVQVAARIVAIRVDGVHGIREVDPAVIQDTRDLAPDAAYLAGIATLPDGLVLIYDLQRFLSSAEAASLRQALWAYGATRGGA